MDDDLDQVFDALPDDSFVTLDEAEGALWSAMGAEEQSKLDQVVAILAIKRNQLYKQRLDPDTGKPFEFFEKYLKSIEPQLEARGAGKVSSIKKWISAYRVYCEQLGWDRDKLLTFGAHAKELLPAANLTHFDSQLEDENKPTTEGGEKLGHVEFKALAEDIYSRVSMNNPDVPEFDWQVKDTREVVREKLGKPDPVRQEWLVEVSGADVIVKELTFFVGQDGVGQMFKFRALDPIPYEYFKQIAKGKIIGLPEGA